jgi:hypothetical protein
VNERIDAFIQILDTASIRPGQLLISRITGEVGPSTDLSGLGVNQDLGIRPTASQNQFLDNFRFADHPTRRARSVLI